MKPELIAAFAVLMSAFALETHGATQRELCGPIAVQAVLDYYGMRVALPDLADDVFAENPGQRSSMAELRDVLESNGIHTLPVMVPRDQQVSWTEPVIIHLPELQNGHFGVLFPSEEKGHDLVSIAPGEYLHWPTKVVANARSELILLTSAKPIELADFEENHRVGASWFFCFFSIAFVSYVLVVTQKLRRRIR